MLDTLVDFSFCEAIEANRIMTKGGNPTADDYIFIVSWVVCNAYLIHYFKRSLKRIRCWLVDAQKRTCTRVHKRAAMT